jgi:hypothetical protein
LTPKQKLVLSGAPNFRKLQEENIYGVGQPTVFGIRAILNQIRYSSSPKGRVTSICLTTLCNSIFKLFKIRPKHTMDQFTRRTNYLHQQTTFCSERI